jgi:hypothetical protein
MKILGIILILISCYCNLSAQNKTGSVNGTVIDKKTGLPLEYASIQLLEPSNKIAIKTTISNKKGKFNLDSIAFGNYSLKVNFMGLIAPIQSVSLTANASTVSIGDISMELSSNTLNEVSVTAKKNMLSSTVGKSILIIYQNIQSTNPVSILLLLILAQRYKLLDNKILKIRKNGFAVIILIHLVNRSK